MKIKSLTLSTILLFISVMFIAANCEDTRTKNTSAKDEQEHTEVNQQRLLASQPPPDITWSLERDNLIKRFKLENDRSVMFYMYVFIEGVGEPIGYYEVNKISSVNSQLMNPEQLVLGDYGQYSGHFVLSSPAEDGSYGSNGDGVFGFTPEDIYIEHNMKYICSTVPLSFKSKPIKLNVINVETKAELDKLMQKIESK